MSRPATSRLKVNPPLGLRPSLEFRRIHELQIDPSYQRTVDSEAGRRLIRQIAMFWDWGLCQPLTVSKRPDGTLMVVDGQHRLEAARARRDIYDLPCVVTNYDSAGDEAAAFVALNRQRRPLSRLDVFKAALAAEDEEANAVLALMEANGLSVAPHQNFISWKPGQVANIAGLQTAYRIHGPKVAGAAMDALSRGFAGVALRYAGTLFPGIVAFLAEAAKSRRPVDQELLVLVLQGADQATWRQELMLEAAASKSGRDQAAKAVIAKAYDEALNEAEAA